MTDKPTILGIGHNIIGDCEYPHIRSIEADHDKIDKIIYFACDLIGALDHQHYAFSVKLIKLQSKRRLSLLTLYLGKGSCQ
mgnify:CR=1 FL=1